MYCSLASSELAWPGLWTELLGIVLQKTCFEELASCLRFCEEFVHVQLKKAGHACSTRDCVQEADTREHRADVHSNLEKYVFFRSIFHNESGLGSAKIGSSKTISKPTGRNANMVCFNKFQRSSTVLHALALMRCLWYEMVYEKACACWRACRIIVWGWKTCTHDPPFSFFAHQTPKHFLPKQKPMRMFYWKKRQTPTNGINKKQNVTFSSMGTPSRPYFEEMPRISACTPKF